MQLSMWILADWLKLYQPECDIQKGGRVLRNARIASDNLWLSPSTLYLHVRDDGEVVCTNGGDRITVRCDDLNDLFNDILDAFEYYSDTYESIRQSILHGCTALELMQNCQVMLPRFMLLADATFYLREIYDPEEVHSKNPYLKELTRKRLMPLRHIQEINRDPKIRERSVRTYPITIRELGTTTVTNLFSGELHEGWLVTGNSESTYTEAVLDLQDALGELFEFWFSQAGGAADQRQKSGVFIDLLDGTAARDETTLTRLQGFQWKAEDPKQLFVLRQIETSRISMKAFQTHLEHLSPQSFFFQYHGNTIYIIDQALTNPAEFPKQFRSSLSVNGFIAGACPVFTDLFRLPDYYQAAIIAADYTEPVPGTVTQFMDKAVPYACALLRNHSSYDLRHPALAELHAYDERHKTDLLETLRIYLESALNIADASRRLYIHRSTFLYRLDRIRELTGIDPDKPEERFHLELSFYLENVTAETPES